MPRFNFRCTQCGGLVVDTVAKACKICGGDTSKVFSPPTDSIVDVVGGYEYTMGKRAWRKTKTVTEQAAILLGDKDPY